MISLFSSIRKIAPLEIKEPVENLAWKHDVDTNESSDKPQNKTDSRTQSKPQPINVVKYLNDFDMFKDERIFN